MLVFHLIIHAVLMLNLHRFYIRYTDLTKVQLNLQIGCASIKIIGLNAVKFKIKWHFIRIKMIILPKVKFSGGL